MTKKSYLEKIFDISHHTIILTGANGQLGMVICKSLIDLGAKVLAIDICDENIKKIRNKNLIVFKFDISNENAVNDFYNSLKKNKIIPSGLINNAAVSFFTHFKNRSVKELDNTYNINLKGQILLIKKIFEGKKLNFYKKIINISSLYGLVSPNFSIYKKNDRRNSEIYGATKAAMIQITKYFSTYCHESKILVNGIAPGGILNEDNPQAKSFQKKYSELCPMKRLAKAEEMIGAIIYLLSESSSYTNGQTIIIDGGYSSW